MYLGMTLARLDDFENACAAYDKVFVCATGRSCYCYVQHLHGATFVLACPLTPCAAYDEVFVSATCGTCMGLLLDASLPLGSSASAS